MDGVEIDCPPGIIVKGAIVGLPRPGPIPSGVVGLAMALTQRMELMAVSWLFGRKVADMCTDMYVYREAASTLD